MNFNDWKRKLEANACRFDDPAARDRAALEQGCANYAEFMGRITDFLDRISASILPEDRKAELAAGFLRSVVDDMTNGCAMFARLRPEEGEAIIDWYENHIRFFNGLIAELEETA